MVAVAVDDPEVDVSEDEVVDAEDSEVEEDDSEEVEEVEVATPIGPVSVVIDAADEVAAANLFKKQKHVSQISHMKRKEEKLHSRGARCSRIRCIVEKNRIDNMDNTVIDKNVWLNDLGAQTVGFDECSRRVGNKL